MRNIYFTLAIISLLMASCSNDDVVELYKGKSISFTTTLSKNLTRVNAENETSSTNEMASFNVTALANEANFKENYFTNLIVTRDGTKWVPASIYYWPLFKLDFVAFSPINLRENSGIDGITIESGENNSTIRGFKPNININKQEDLLISRIINPTKEQPVELNFKHALSQIEIQAKCSNANYRVKVKGVSIKNVKTKGKFTFPYQNTNKEYKLLAESWKPETIGKYTTKREDNQTTNDVTLTSEAQSIMFGNYNFMLIPQTTVPWAGDITKSGSYISVLCNITSVSDDSQIYPIHDGTEAPEQNYAYAAVPIKFEWIPGIKYVYVLNFFGSDGGGGEVDPDPDITDPEVDPDPGGGGGDEILGGPISYKVTLDSWDKTEPVNTDVDMK